MLPDQLLVSLLRTNWQISADNSTLCDFFAWTIWFGYHKAGRLKGSKFNTPAHLQKHNKSPWRSLVSDCWHTQKHEKGKHYLKTVSQGNSAHKVTWRQQMIWEVGQWLLWILANSSEDINMAQTLNPQKTFNLALHVQYMNLFRKVGMLIWEWRFTSLENTGTYLYSSDPECSSKAFIIQPMGSTCRAGKVGNTEVLERNIFLKYYWIICSLENIALGKGT